jgi:hypothetical protein
VRDIEWQRQKEGEKRRGSLKKTTAVILALIMMLSIVQPMAAVAAQSEEKLFDSEMILRRGVGAFFAQDNNPAAGWLTPTSFPVKYGVIKSPVPFGQTPEALKNSVPEKEWLQMFGGSNRTRVINSPAAVAQAPAPLESAPEIEVKLFAIPDVIKVTFSLHCGMMMFEPRSEFQIGETIGLCLYGEWLGAGHHPQLAENTTFVITNGIGQVVWSRDVGPIGGGWSGGPGGGWGIGVGWGQVDNEGNPVAPGKYYAGVMFTNTALNIAEDFSSIIPLRIIDIRTPTPQGWSSDIRLTHHGVVVAKPSITVDLNNNVHIVWTERSDDGNHWEIKYMKLDNHGNVLVEDKRITSGWGYTDGNRQIVTDSKGNVHIVWRDFAGWRTDLICYVKLDNEGNMLISPKIISLQDNRLLQPSIVVDSNDNLHMSADAFWASRYLKLDNTGRVLIEKSIDGGLSPSIAVDSHDNIYFTRIGWSRIVLTKLDNHGNLLIGALKVSPVITTTATPKIAIDSSNNIHLVWQGQDANGIWQLYYLKLDSAGNVLVPTKVITNRITEGGWIEDLSISIDSNDDLHIVWPDNRDSMTYHWGNSEIYYIKLNNNGDILIADTRLTSYGGASQSPSIAVDSTNKVHVVWIDNRHALSDIYYKYFDPEQPEPELTATINNHTVTPRELKVGEKVTIGFTFTNTGNARHTFGAGATLRSPDGRRINFLTPVTVAPGAAGSAQWTHTVDTAGRWDVVFGVWEESAPPLRNLLVQTGWVAEHIRAADPEIAARINRHTVSTRKAAIEDTITFGFNLTNTGRTKQTFGAGASLRRPDGTLQPFLKPITLAPDESKEVQWSHAVDMIGRWDVAFDVWKESTPPLTNRLAGTGWVSESVLVTLGEAHNSPPQASFTYAVDGLTVRFTSTSTDPDNNIISHRWEFGDGSVSRKRNPVHTFEGSFNYQVVHTVVDRYGRISSEARPVEVVGKIKSVSYPNPTLMGSPLRINVATSERGLPVTVSVGNITETKESVRVVIPIINLPLTGAAFSVDTTDLGIGTHELIVNVDGEIYRSTINIRSAAGLGLINEIRNLRTVAEKEMRQIASYPAGALAKKILKEAYGELTDEAGDILKVGMGGTFGNEVRKLTERLPKGDVREAIEKKAVDWITEFFTETLLHEITKRAGVKEFAEGALGNIIQTGIDATLFIDEKGIIQQQQQEITEKELQALQNLPPETLSKLSRLLRVAGREAIENTDREVLYRLHIGTLPIIGDITANPTLSWFKKRHEQSLEPDKILWGRLICPIWTISMSNASGQSILTLPASFIGIPAAAPDDEHIGVQEIRPRAVPIIVAIGKAALKYIKVTEKVKEISPYILAGGLIVSADILAKEVAKEHGQIIKAIETSLNPGTTPAGRLARPLFIDGKLEASVNDTVLILSPAGEIVGFNFIREGERVKAPPEYRIVSLGARESFRVAAPDLPPITIKLTSSKEAYELGENARIKIVIKNETNAPMENLLLWFFVPEENILEREMVSLEAHSELVREYEFEVTQQMLYAPTAFLTLFDRMIAEDVTSFNVGGVKQRRAFMSIDYAEFADPGAIEMKVTVENVGNREITPALHLGGTFGNQTIELPAIPPQKTITEAVYFTITDPGTYTASFTLAKGEEVLHVRQADFTVRAKDTLLAKVSTDNPVYKLNDTVQVSVTVENATFQPVEFPYELEIITPSGQIIDTLSFVAKEAGTYIARATPIAEGHAVVPDETQFIVARQSGLIIAPSFEQKTLSVRVFTDAGGPVKGAKVTADNLIGITDEKGMVSFENVEEKRAIFIRAEKMGFDPAVTATAPKLKAISITPEKATVIVNKAQQFTAAPIPAEALLGEVTWSVDNNTVGTIDKDGLFTALAPGTVTVTAKSAADPTVSDTAAVTVAAALQPAVAGISLSQVLDENGIVVIPVKVTRVKNPLSGTTVNIPGGLGAYKAKITTSPEGGIQVLAVRGTAYFPDVTFDPATGIFAATKAPAPGQPNNTAVAKLVLRLTGSAEVSHNITVTFQEIIAAETGLKVPAVKPISLAFHRGDANGDGRVNIVDAMFIAQKVVGIRGLDTVNALNAASVRHDGAGGDRVNIVDAMFIAQHVVRIRDKYFE